MSRRSDRSPDVVIEYDEFLERRIASAPIEWIDEQLKAQNLDYVPLLQNVRTTVGRRKYEATMHECTRAPLWSRFAAAVLLAGILFLMTGERRNVEATTWPPGADRMSFVLRIFFSGQMAFLPSADGEELSVVLLGHTQEPVRGEVTRHKPLLLARAGGCEPACSMGDAHLSRVLFTDTSPEAAIDVLEAALASGGAWQLSSSELFLVPTTTNERADFSWVTDLSGVVQNDILLQPGSSSPPSALIAGRLRLRTSKTLTYSVSRVQDPPRSANSQTLATWVAADIRLEGDGVEIAEQDRGYRVTRSMRLHPRNGRVELAVLNRPQLVPSTPQPAGSPPGTHFETYYDLAETPLRKPPK